MDTVDEPLVATLDEDVPTVEPGVTGEIVTELLAPSTTQLPSIVSNPIARSGDVQLTPP